MILENDTFEKFGYYPNKMNPKAHKKIIVKCDKCNKIRTIEYRNYKDLCSSCSRIGNIPWNKGLKAEDDERVKRNCDAMHKAHCGKSSWNKNIPWSLEMKQKLSKAHEGQHSSPKTEFEKGHIPINKGKLLSKETKEKISKSVIAKEIKGKNHPFYGKHHTEESKKKMSEANSGEKNSRWRGGISYEPYCSKFNDEFKETIREQFNRKCFICNKSETENKEKLSVHHVNYNKNCLCDDSKCKFVPLCRSCHAKTTNNRQYWKEYFQSKILEFNNK